VIVSGGSDNTIRDWDLDSGQPLGEPLKGPDVSVRTVAVGELQGRPVIVSGGAGAMLAVWDMVTGQPVGEPFLGHDTWVSSVAVGEREGRPVIVSGGTTVVIDYELLRDDVNQTVGVWDMATGRPVGEPLEGQICVSSVAVGELEGRPVVISGGNSGTVRVWDLATGRTVSEPYLGHEVWVRSVAVGDLAGRAVIVTGGSHDGTLRVWDLATGQLVGEPMRGHSREVNSVAVGELEGHPVIVSGGDDGMVRVWGLGGQPEFDLRVGATINAIVLPPGSRIVIGTSKGLMVLKWNAMSQFPEGTRPISGL
jgi:WD40 repeat protein